MSAQLSLAAASVYTLSAGRIGAAAAVVVGLTGVFLGWRALARPTGGRSKAGAAMVAGVISLALGGLVVVTSDGSVGTGNGLGGAIVALLVGLIATALGGLALARRHGGQETSATRGRIDAS